MVELIFSFFGERICNLNFWTFLTFVLVPVTSNYSSSTVNIFTTCYVLYFFKRKKKCSSILLYLGSEFLRQILLTFSMQVHCQWECIIKFLWGYISETGSYVKHFPLCFSLKSHMKKLIWSFTNKCIYNDKAYSIFFSTWTILKQKQSFI